MRPFFTRDNGRQKLRAFELGAQALEIKMNKRKQKLQTTKAHLELAVAIRGTRHARVGVSATKQTQIVLDAFLDGRGLNAF